MFSLRARRKGRGDNDFVLGGNRVNVVTVVLDVILGGSRRTPFAGGLIWGVIRAFGFEGKTGDGSNVVLDRNRTAFGTIVTRTSTRGSRRVVHALRRRAMITLNHKVEGRRCGNKRVVWDEDRTNSSNVVLEAGLKDTPQMLCTSIHLKMNPFASKIERKNRGGERITLVEDRADSANAVTLMANASGRVLRRVQVALVVVVLAHMTHSIVVWAGLGKVLKLEGSHKAPLAPGGGPGMNESPGIEIARAVEEEAREGTRRG